MEAFGHVQAHQASVTEASADSGTTHRVDEKDEVDSLMTRLPENLRSVMQMFYIDGGTYQQISERLSVPMNSIGPMLARAKAMLQQTRKPST
jgi:RNA polymerase sigma-70 factor, ECF subfamily